jgi:hypothetical protein
MFGLCLGFFRPRRPPAYRPPYPPNVARPVRWQTDDHLKEEDARRRELCVRVGSPMSGDVSSPAGRPREDANTEEAESLREDGDTEVGAATSMEGGPRSGHGGFHGRWCELRALRPAWSAVRVSGAAASITGGARSERCGLPCRWVSSDRRDLPGRRGVLRAVGPPPRPVLQSSSGSPDGHIGVTVWAASENFRNSECLRCWGWCSRVEIRYS